MTKTISQTRTMKIMLGSMSTSPDLMNMVGEKTMDPWIGRLQIGSVYVLDLLPQLPGLASSHQIECMAITVGYFPGKTT
jgi:hypothetical protein